MIYKYPQAQTSGTYNEWIGPQDCHALVFTDGS